MSDYVQEFKNKLLPYAQRAGQALNIPVEVVLAQWAWESDYGRSALANGAANYAGIKKVGTSISSGAYTVGSNVYAKYNSLSQFTDDYIRVLNNGYYEAVKAAVDIPGTLTALGKSPYAESPYKDSSGKAGFGLVGVISKLFGTNIPIPTSVPTSIEGMNTDDLKKYAGFGIAVLAIAMVIIPHK